MSDESQTVRVRFLSIDTDAKGGASAVLSPGSEYEIEQDDRGLWTLTNAHGSQIGFFRVVPQEAERIADLCNCGIVALQGEGRHAPDCKVAVDRLRESARFAS